MATITFTRAKVYSDTIGTTQVGQTIEVQGSPQTIAINNSTLGVNLSPGSQYSVSVQCTNDENYTTDWTAPYPFKTLILGVINTLTGENGRISAQMAFTYNKDVLTVSECGVYVSTNASGAGAVKKPAPNEQEATRGFDITELTENTTYYVVPFVLDNLNREYVGSWSDASTANTGYNVPAITISNTATTYNSVSGNLNVETNDTLSEVYIDIWPTGGQTHYRINKSATTGNQNFTITDGDTDSNGDTIVISPSTEIRLTVYATNTSGGTGTAQATVTTAAQSTATISITGIQDVTPNSAVVTLSYGVGA